MKPLFILSLLVATSSFAGDLNHRHTSTYNSFTSTEAFHSANAGELIVPGDSTFCACLKPLFNYLLASSRLNIAQGDNITVQSIINDAILAGFPVNASNCPLLTNNLNKLFYTITPSVVEIPGFIVAPQGAAYRAMLGTCRIKFAPVGGSFEHKLSAFYSKGCDNDSIVGYAAMPANIPCLKYNISHTAEGNLDWYVSYTDCDGNRLTKWLKPSDASFEFCATTIHSIQDEDTTNLVHVAAWYSLTSAISADCSNSANYQRQTTATLEVEDYNVVLRTAKENLEVKVFPNPSSSSFQVTASSNNSSPVVYNIVDFSGRIIETHSANGTSRLTMGASLKPGVYFVEAKQAGARKVVKVVKN